MITGGEDDAVGPLTGRSTLPELLNTRIEIHHIAATKKTKNDHFDIERRKKLNRAGKWGVPCVGGNLRNGSRDEVGVWVAVRKCGKMPALVGPRWRQKRT